MKENSRALALADTILKRYPNPDDYPYRSWSYPQGYLMIGLSKLWKETGDRRYYDYIYRYCEIHVNDEGDVSGFTGCSMDDMMPGAILVWMYEQTHEQKYAKACRNIRALYDDYPRTREGGFLHDRNRFPGEMWVDGVFMGQMFLCRYGKTFNEPECWDEAIRQLDIIHGYCHRMDGLLVHAYSQDRLALWADKDGRSSEIWSEGLGWYALILVEILDIIPAGFAGRERVERYCRELAAGLKKNQCLVAGLWHQVVDKGEDQANWCDTSGSAMFTYMLKRAIDTGIIPAEDYLPIVQRSYEALLKRIVYGEDRLLDVTIACEGLCVQLYYNDYISYPRKVNAQEAVCGCLWAITIMERD